jgi:hypothetical protein
MGLVEDRGILIYALDGRRYQASHKLIRPLPLPLPFPLNKLRGYLSVEHPGGRDAITAGWREGMLNFSIEISGKEFGAGPRLSASRMPDYFKYYFPHQVYVEGMKRFRYANGRINLIEYGAAESPYYLPEGVGFTLKRPMLPEPRPPASSYPSLEQFLATEEWQEVLELSTSLSQAADRIREQSSKGQTHRLHIPHPSGKHTTHN